MSERVRERVSDDKERKGRERERFSVHSVLSPKYRQFLPPTIIRVILHN